LTATGAVMQGPC